MPTDTNVNSRSWHGLLEILKGKLGATTHAKTIKHHSRGKKPHAAIQTNSVCNILSLSGKVPLQMVLYHFDQNFK